MEKRKAYKRERDLIKFNNHEEAEKSQKVTFIAFYKELIPFHIEVAIRPKALEPNLFYLPFLGLHLVFSTNVIAYVFMGHATYNKYLRSSEGERGLTREQYEIAPTSHV